MSTHGDLRGPSSAPHVLSICAVMGTNDGSQMSKVTLDNSADMTETQTYGSSSPSPARETAEQVHIESYYSATANRKALRPSLQGDFDADVCVIGAGFTGLSTALALAERGYAVCVLEAKAIGWGASGRNGGQVVNGLNASLDKIERQFGEAAASFVGRLVQDGGEIIRKRIQNYNIQCDYISGNIFAAYTDKQMTELESKQRQWRTHGMDDHELLDADGIQQHIGSKVYRGGMIDHSGGHVHPLNLALGQADAIESLGGHIFELSEVTGVDTAANWHVVSTPGGQVRTKTVVLCGNAYMSGVVPEIERRVMPVSTQVITTEKLSGALCAELLPTNLCVEDVRYILDYYRLTADGRMLFGGGLVYGGTTPTDIQEKLWPNMKKVFPQLANVRIDYAWSGNIALSYSRVPQMGRLDNGVYFAHGYSGHGVTGSHLFGVILAEAIDGDASRFDVFAGLPYYAFPGGRALRVPYSILGSWWYGLRDKLGV